MQWRMGSVALASVVRDAVAATTPLLDERKIKLSMDLEEDLFVEADPDRLQQVVINLIGNACKFASTDRGRIHITIGTSLRGTMLRIEDDGPGVPIEDREAIFGKFTQLSDGLMDKPEGTGLGLSISRHIIDAFGGSISVEDSSLGGAAFVAVLRPARPPVRATAVHDG